MKDIEIKFEKEQYTSVCERATIDFISLKQPIDKNWDFGRDIFNSMENS